MKLNKEVFLAKYKSLSTDELIELNNSAELVEDARLALSEEMNNRGLSETEIQRIHIETEHENIKSFNETPLPEQPKIWIGFLITLLVTIVEVAYISSRESDLFLMLLTILSISGYLYWLSCVYRIHQILKGLTFRGHPISARKAVGFHFIPVFNFYWVFKWPIEFSKTINSASENKMIHGSIVGVFILISLITLRIDSAIGLACLFSVTIFLNNKIRSANKIQKIG